MGWDGTAAYGRTKQEFINDELKNYYNIVASNWSGNTFFAALSSKEEPRKVFAVVILVRKDGDYWMKKSMDEGTGPYYDGASKKVMSVLSPLADLYNPDSFSFEYATSWRQRQVKKKKPTKLIPGLWYEMSRPIRFTNGSEYSVLKKIAGVNLWETETGVVVRLNMKRANVEVTPRQQTQTTIQTHKQTELC